MYTEEDTFNRLKKTPFRQLFISIIEPCIWGQDLVPENRYPKIQAAGWNVEEFLAVMYKEMDKDAITGDVVRLQSKAWQEHYLKTGPI